MDRFIEIDNCGYLTHKLCLKSNMDRFIVSPTVQQVRWLACLKSNMDRFIVDVLATVCVYGNV